MVSVLLVAHVAVSRLEREKFERDYNAKKKEELERDQKKKEQDEKDKIQIKEREQEVS